MALIGSASVWRDSIIATISTGDLSAGELTILKTFWLNVCQVHETHIVTNALINTIVTTPDTINGTGIGTPPTTGIS